MNFLSILTGCFATPVAESPTVVMVEAAYRHHGIDARYINCDVPPELLGDAVRGAWAMGWVGFNCSLPHKVAVIDYLDGLGKSAEIMGAVNCAVRRGDQFIGENTDGRGFLKSLMEVVDPKGKRIVMFGAGGAARAIGVELALAGAKDVIVVNRSPGRGETLVKLLADKTPASAEFAAWDEPYVISEDTDIVVNATSIGLYPDVTARLDIVPETMKPGMIVADVIPNPPRTPFLRHAEAQGCTVLDGLGMLINQGILGIKYLDRSRCRPRGHARCARADFLRIAVISVRVDVASGAQKISACG